MSSSNSNIPSRTIKKKRLDNSVLTEEKQKSAEVKKELLIDNSPCEEKDESAEVKKELLIDNSPCDCLDTDCPGCFYPCELCGSVKCGPDCRIGREWNYEKIVIQK